MQRIFRSSARVLVALCTVPGGMHTVSPAFTSTVSFPTVVQWNSFVIAIIYTINMGRSQYADCDISTFVIAQH